jgi:hypothetical protein
MLLSKGGQTIGFWLHPERDQIVNIILYTGADPVECRERFNFTLVFIVIDRLESVQDSPVLVLLGIPRRP